MKITVKLFWLGLTIHLLYLLIIYVTGSYFADFWHTDHGQLTTVLSHTCPDSGSYIEAADNFRMHGIFGSGDSADYHRTIGYPFIIYIFKIFFGNGWYYGLVIFQAVFSAVIYPLIYGIGKILLNRETPALYYACLAVLFLGGYFTRTFFVMTDLLCAVFFILGIYLGLRSLLGERQLFFALASVLALSFAALIRPVLMLYPFVHILLLFYVAKLYNRNKLIPVQRLIIISTLLLALGCNSSSFRMYYYYKKWTPSDVLSINMFTYTVKEVTAKENNTALFEEENRVVNAEKDSFKQSRLRQDYFSQVIKKYPSGCLRYWTEAIANHFLSPHYIETSGIYGYYKRNMTDCIQEKKASKLVAVLFYIFLVFNLLLILLPFSAALLYKVVKDKKYLFALTMTGFVLVIMGPTFIASTGPRMRMMVEPFMVIIAFDYLYAVFKPGKLVAWLNFKLR
jgi:4-amino-4-deoxy-L-arabinose transferase-like glycosyltransferase